MKTIMVMFDSLNRHYLPPYGNDWVKAPNFQRLAQKSVQFQSSYVCSMPCMPARRDLLTGRPNFLHRSWGPVEPFDTTFTQLLKQHGVHTHLATDHQHYFEDGGCTYHNRYTTWEFFRGQEGDPWKGQVAQATIPPNQTPRETRNSKWQQDLINRQFIRSEEQWPSSQTFAAGIDFIRRNHKDDNWFLQIETFDPHEPFFAPDRYRNESGALDYDGLHFDWPPYDKVNEPEPAVQQLRKEYAALVQMCDAHLGKVLDQMDELKMWDDTMLIVWTDHGFLLGERGLYAKCWVPFYEEIAHTPFFIWDPRHKAQGQTRQSLVQPSIDLAPTILELFGAPIPDTMTGHSIQPIIQNDTPTRDSAIFGLCGLQLNVTDGRYVYMRPPNNEKPMYEYTLMPTHMRSFFSIEELKDNIQLAEPFPFTHGVKTMKIQGYPAFRRTHEDAKKTLLFDLETDPTQQHSIENPEIEARMLAHLKTLLAQNNAPQELYDRYGLSTND